MSGVFVFRQPPQGFHTEYFGGGGGKGGTTVQSTQIPPEVLARYNAVNARAEKVADTPFQRYGGEFVAPINAQQTAGIGGINAAANQAQPYYGAATDLTMSGIRDVGPLTQQQIGYYQNPFTQAVVDPTMKALQQQQGQQRSQQQAQMAKAGAFGNSRSGLDRAVLAGQQGLAMSQAISPLYAQGYQNAVQTAQTQQGVVASDLARRMQGAQQIAGLGTAAQTAGLQGAQAQIAAGTLQQQTQQARDTALYQQHLQEQGYPFQVAQFLANIAEGTGALSGNTTTQNKSGGFFSNRGGFKVNERPARAYGGGLDVNSMGGAVYDPGEYASGGYAEGGVPSMDDILATQQAMFMGQGSPYGQGQKPGAGLGIPSQSAKITPLQVKPIAQEQRGQDPLTQAANFGKGLVETKKAGQEIKSWFDKKPEGGKGETAPADGKTADPTKGGVLADSKGNVTVSGQAVQTGTNNGMTPSGPVYSGPKVQGVKTSEMGGNLNFGPEIKDPGKGLAFNTSNSTPNLEGSTAGFGSAPDMGGDQVASLGEDLGGADFGDLGSWFGNRGGAVPDYACGGVAGGHRDGYAGKGFVTPGYDPEVPGTDIMDTTVDEGEQSVNQLKGEQDAMNPKVSGGGGGGSGIGQALGTAISIGKFFLKDGGAVPRYGYADGGGSGPVSGGLDIDRLNALLSAGSKAANTAPISYKTDDGTELRGQTVRSGPFAEYGVGLGTNLGGGRLDVDAARGSAPNSPAQYRGGLKWSKNFADGGLAYREHHANPDETNDFSNVVGEKFNPEDVAAAAEENAPTGVDPRLVAMTPDQPVREITMDPSLMSSESGGDFRAKNDAVGHGGMKGHFGRGQFGQARLQDAMNAGVLPKGTTPEQFMDSEELQKATEKWHFGDISQHIANKGLDKAIGTTINGIPVTEQGMLNVAHLGGKGGLEKFIASGGKYDPPDENGKRLSDYLALGAGVKPAAPTRTASNEYGGNSAKSASIGDVVREYAPSGMPTSENFWVPALGFLGGMLTSPNRSLAGAIGSGLVSGTSGYMELRKGQQEDIKNAFANFKDQFVDAINPDTKMPAKKDKYTGKFYEPDQAQDVLAKRIRAIGADPAAYGIMESNPPAAGKTGTSTTVSGPLLPPVASGKPIEKVEEPKLPGELAKPPADLAKTDMNFQQLRASIYHDWKNSGLSDDPKVRLTRAKNYRDDAAAYERLGTADALAHAAKLNEAANKETELLNKELDAAAKRQDAINTENDKISSVSAGDFAKEAAGRIATYDRRREQIEEINRMFSDLRGGRAAPALAEMNSWLASAGVPVDSKRASDTDYVTKLVMTKMAEDIATDKLMRAPASGMKALIQTMPSASMDPGATYTLLGQMMGEMDYVHRRDLAYKRGTDPFDFAKEWETKNGRSLKHDIATGLSQLKLHEGMSPDVIKSLYEKYGKYGYNPQGMQEAQKPAAPTVAPGKQAGERKQFKQGWGVWNGSQWVPEGQ